MDWGTIILLTIGVIATIAGLLLSPTGSTSGLSAMAGQDLELFKKTKDRGFFKILQMIMFVLIFVMAIICIVYKILYK